MTLSILTLIGSITSQLSAASQALTGIGAYKMERRKVQNEAVAAMRKALNRTRRFLRKPDFSDEEALQNISDLWNEASEKVGIVNPSLGKMLGMKSRFWGDYEQFVALGKDNEVMSLNDVVSEIERLYNKMK